MEIEKYEKVKNCYVGEIDGYGYALVPGSKRGVILLDLRTKNLLNSLSLFQKEQDEKRVQLLLENELIQQKNQNQKRPILNKSKITGISTWLHISNFCNLDCFYCYIGGKQNDFMTYPVADAYLDSLEKTIEKHNLKSVAIRFAGGEPTLCEDLIVYLAEQFNKRFVQKGIVIKLILLTNGTVVSSKLINVIKKYSIRICLSLDGLGDWHNQTRCFKNGVGSFDMVSKNLELYLTNDINPTILTTITEKNVLGIPELSRFLIDRNLSFWHEPRKSDTVFQIKR